MYSLPVKPKYTGVIESNEAGAMKRENLKVNKYYFLAESKNGLILGK